MRQIDQVDVDSKILQKITVENVFLLRPFNGCDLY